MRKILIVEDDRELNQGISYALGQGGYLAIPAYSIQEAQELYTKEGADLVLLDVNLPDGEGFEFCRFLRGKSETPVMFLTARDLEEDVLKGFELGADDYITKPFSIHVLRKKIDVILRRLENHPRKSYDDGFLRIDFDKAQVSAGDRICSITPTEFRMLRLFIDHAGQLMTYSVLLEALWDMGAQFVDKHALAVNVNRLRGKIEDEEHRYISNIYGMGYQWLD